MLNEVISSSAPIRSIPDHSTTFLAIYAAILSTVTFCWNLFRDLRDRGKLKVSGTIRRIAFGEDGSQFAVKPDLPVQGASEQLFIVMTVTNIGRRPMRWEGWGGKYKDPHQGKTGVFCVPRHLPKIIAEREQHQEYTELENDLDLRNIKYFSIWDGADGEWKLSWCQMRNLIKEAEVARTSNSLE